MTLNESVSWFLYCCANLLPELALIIITCRDFLRFSLKKTIVLSSIVLLWYYCCVMANEFGLISYLTMNYMLNIGYIFFGIALTKGKPYQLLFTLSIALNYGSICAIISGGIFYSLGLGAFIFSWQESLLTLGIAAVFWILYYRMLSRHLHKLFLQREADVLWRVLWLVPALFCVIHYFSIWSQNGKFSESIINVCFLTVLNLGSAFVSVLIAYMADSKAEQIRLESENQRLAMQMSQYEDIKMRIEEARVARHDLRQHLRLLQSFVDSGNECELRKYLKTYSEALPCDTSIKYCENTVADMVVRYYAELAHQKNIAFSSAISLPAELSLPEPDICVLFGNLLENALDSCKKHLDSSPYIHIGSKLMGTQMLTIIIDNFPSDEPKKENDILLSSKRQSIGTGTLSIRSIAQRYGGEARFYCKDSVFSAEIILTLPKTEQ